MANSIFVSNPEACERFKDWYYRISGLTYSQLAKMMGVSVPTAKKRAQNPSTLKDTELDKLRELLGLDWFSSIFFPGLYYMKDDLEKEKTEQDKYRLEVIKDITLNLKRLPLITLEIIQDEIDGILNSDLGYYDNLTRVDR